MENFLKRKVLSVMKLQREPSQIQLAVLLNIPTIIFFLVIIAFPFCYEFYVSVHKVTLKALRGGEMPFVGLLNYLNTMKDPLFLKSIWNTFIIGVVSVFGSVSLGLCFALLMNRKNSIFAWLIRALVMLPWAVTPIAGGIMWGFFYNPKYGYLNAIALKLNLTDTYINVIGNPTLAIWAVIIAYIWRVMPFSAIILYAALKTIPEEIYEAAMVDGAGTWRQFISITLPFLRPALAVILIMRTAFAFMVFDEVLAITHGGPANETWTAVFYSYITSFKYFEFGKGSASAFFVTIIISIFAAFYIWKVYKEIGY